MVLTPEDVRNKQFTTVRFKEGYDLDEVDEFLDAIEGELTRLVHENEDLRATSRGELPTGLSEEMDELRAQSEAARSALAASQEELNSLRAELQAARNEADEARRSASDGNSAGIIEDLNRQLRAIQDELASSVAERDQLSKKIEELSQENEALVASASNSYTEIKPPADASAASVRVLELAQRTADEAVANARMEAEQMLADATGKADSLVFEAKNQAITITRELETQRVSMERRVEELRAYEREYRSRLRSYLEGQLRELDGKAVGGEIEQ